MANSGSAQWLKLFPEKLFYLQTRPDRRFKCHVCCMTVGGSMYYSKDGDIAVHQECAMLEDKIIVLEGGKPILFKLRKGEAMSDCTKCKTRNPKVFSNIKGFRYESLSGDRTRTLHVSCYNRTSNREISGPHNLRKLLSTNLMFEWCPKGPSAPCDMCCMMVEGPMYRCKEKNFALHRECAMLKKKILLVEGDKATVLEIRQGEAKSNCVKCTKRKPKGSQGKITGFCYESSSGHRTLHVSCFIKSSSAVQKPNNKHQKNGRGDRMVSKVYDAMADEVSATIFSALLGDFSPMLAVVVKVAAAFASTSSKK